MSVKAQHCDICGIACGIPSQCWPQRNNKTVCQGCAELIDFDDRLPSEVASDERELLLDLLSAAREYCEDPSIEGRFLLEASVQACKEIEK